jgi:hypothetical protein
MMASEPMSGRGREEKALRASEERFHTAFTHAAVGIAIDSRR